MAHLTPSKGTLHKLLRWPQGTLASSPCLCLLANTPGKTTCVILGCLLMPSEFVSSSVMGKYHYWPHVCEIMHLKCQAHLGKSINSHTH
jgi:hypothetical protein